MSDFLDDLTSLVRSISLENLPSSVIHEGRRTLVDTVGVILAGMTEAPNRTLAGQMARASVAPCSTIFGSGYRGDAMWAALAHGTAGLWHELAPGNRFVGGHPAVHAVSAGLAVAERKGSSGRQLLESVIAGYEFAARVGLGTTLRPGIDPNGSWPLVGAAVTAGILMNYGHDDLRETVNVSTTLNLASSIKTAYEGATIRNAYAGIGSAMGVLAADLVRDGFTGERDGISTVFGCIAGVFFDVEKALEEIGQRWEIERGYHKLHACARPIHAALDALIALIKENDVSPNDVMRIEVRTDSIAASMNNVAPENSLAAKFSISYALASYLILRDTGISAFNDSTVQDPKIKTLASRIIVQEDREMNARTPLERPATVHVKLRNEKMLERSVNLPSGEFDTNPLKDDDLNAKFLSLASPLIGTTNATSLLERLWKIETVPTVQEVTALAITSSL